MGPLLLSGWFYKDCFIHCQCALCNCTLPVIFLYCRCVSIVHALSAAVKWMEKAVEGIRVRNRVRLSCSALLCSRESGTGTGPGTDQHKSAEVHPQTLQAVGGQVEMVSCDTDKPSLGGTVRLPPLSISRIRG